MHPVIKGLVIAAIPVVTVASLAGSASASVSSTFIGKGDVQTAFNLTNPAIQKLIDGNEKAFTFTSKQAITQAVEQALSQSATQTATQEAAEFGSQVVKQSATQEVTETLTCVKSNGNVNQRSRHGVREASRSAIRSATREGERTGSRSSTKLGVRDGSRSGIVLGNIDASIDAKARKTGQWTGWNIKSVTPQPATFGLPSWGADNFGDYAWGNYTWGDYTWGDYEFGSYELPAYQFGPVTSWSAWDTDNDPNADPDTCFNNGNIVENSFHDDFSYGEIQESLVDTSAPIVSAGVDETAVDEALPVENAVVGYDGPVTVLSTTNGPVVVFASLNGGTPKALNAV